MFRHPAAASFGSSLKRTPLLLLALSFGSEAHLWGQTRFAQIGKHHIDQRYSSFAGTFFSGPIVPVDVDMDGDIDVVAAGSKQIRLYLNDGEGVFTDVTKTHMPPHVGDGPVIVAGDVDGDRDPDLVLGIPAKQNRLYINDGRGKYQDATSGRMPTEHNMSRDLALADVDRDGDNDLLIAISSGQNKLYLNGGKGRFTDATARLPKDQDSTWSVAVGDVDRDGDLDVVWGGASRSPGAKLYLNNGKGRFADRSTGRLPAIVLPIWHLAFGDVDKDGDLDLLIASGQNRLFRNRGNGVFFDDTSSSLPWGGSATFDLGDLDGDGDLDLVLSSSPVNSKVPFRIQSNDGLRFIDLGSRLTSPVNEWIPSRVALADVDKDGDLDLFGGRLLRPPKLYLNHSLSGKKPFFKDATAPQQPAPYGLFASAFGDIDGDGDLDLLEAQAGKQVYLNDGRANFVRAAATGLPEKDSKFTVLLLLGDIDRDGDLDLYAGNQALNPSQSLQDQLYVNDGGGKFADATPFFLPRDNDGVTTAAFADVDGDNDLDLVIVVNSVQVRIKLYSNDGRGKFTDARGRIPQPKILNTRSMVVVDVDLDGDKDIVLGSYQTQNFLYLNDGKGNFTNGTSSRLPSDKDPTWAVLAGDVDGDHDPDLITVNQYGPNRLYLNDGKGTFKEATKRVPEGSSHLANNALADVDDDGDLDLVLGDVGNQLFLNDGKGRFQATSGSRLPGLRRLRPFHFVDLDRDGDLDLYTPSGLFLNLYRHLHAPLLARTGSQYRLYVFSLPGDAKNFQLAIPFVSLAERSIQIPRFGRFGLEPFFLVVGNLRVIQPPAGTATISLRLPRDKNLLQTTLFHQSLVIRDLANPPGIWRFTNVVADTVIQ